MANKPSIWRKISNNQSTSTRNNSRLGAYEDESVDGVKSKNLDAVRMLGQMLCEVIASPLPECFLKMDIMSDWGTLPLPDILSRRHIKLPFSQY